MSRFLAVAVAVAIVLSVVAGCGPDEESGPDLSRFAAVSPEAPPAVGR